MPRSQPQAGRPQHEGNKVSRLESTCPENPQHQEDGTDGGNHGNQQTMKTRTPHRVTDRWGAVHASKAGRQGLNLRSAALKVPV
jgi:hypothetical protein